MSIITTAEAAEKYGIDEKRLLGVLWAENDDGKNTMPLGDFAQRKVQDDERLQLWVEKQRSL